MSDCIALKALKRQELSTHHCTTLLLLILNIEHGISESEIIDYNKGAIQRLSNRRQCIFQPSKELTLCLFSFFPTLTSQPKSVKGKVCGSKVTQ